MTDRMLITVIQVHRAPDPTPMDLTSRGMTMVTRVPGIMAVPVEVSMARLSRCLVSRVERGTIRLWLRE